MILFFDTSALIKRYISERGSDKVDELFNMATQIFVSAIKLIEQYQLKSLDSIQLSTALYCKSLIDHLVAADIRLLKSAKSEKLKTINPTEK